MGARARADFQVLAEPDRRLLQEHHGLNRWTDTGLLHTSGVPRKCSSERRGKPGLAQFGSCVMRTRGTDTTKTTAKQTDGKVVAYSVHPRLSCPHVSKQSCSRCCFHTDRSQSVLERHFLVALVFFFFLPWN